MNKYSFLFMLGTIVLASCVGIKTKFSKSDLKWLPYNSGDTLIFQCSNTGYFDTTFMMDKKIWYSEYNPVEVHEKYHPQSAEIWYYNSHISYVDPQNKRKKFIEMEKSVPDKPAIITIDYFNGGFLSNRCVFNKNPSVMKIGDKYYSDIIIIYKDLTFSENRVIPGDLNQPRVLYWSVREGLVKYENYKNETWSLIHRSHVN